MKWPAYLSNMGDVCKSAARLVAQHEAQQAGTVQACRKLSACAELLKLVFQPS